MSEVHADLLGRRWVHSHEEDSETKMVFRPETYDFPLSRGRTSFLLRDDGTFSEWGIGPTDRAQEATGVWELEDDRHVILREQVTPVVRRRLDIEAVSEDRLILWK